MGVEIVALLLSVGFGGGFQAPPPDRLTPPIRVTDTEISGNPVRVFPSPAKQGVVTFFVLGGSKDEARDAPEYKHIAEEYGRKGWKFYVVYAGGGSSSPKEQMEAARSIKYPFPVIRRDEGIFQLGQITVAPEAAVFDRRGNLLYHGRIDDRYDAGGHQRRATVTHFLVNALVQVERHKPVEPSYVAPVGLAISMD
jgi:hypothetical protein